MRMSMSWFLAAAAASYGSLAMACEAPSAVVIPDGKTSTLEQMLEAQTQVKSYQAAMTEFLACIDGELESQGDQAPEEFKQLVVARHNAAVAEMEGVAAAFNDQIKAYRAANPAPAN